MSHLSQAIEKLLAERKLKGADINRVTGISEAQISKWLSGAQSWISEEHLSKVSKAIARTPSEEAELVAAHCRDERYGPSANLVSITVKGENELRESPAPYGTKLPNKDEHALHVLAQHMPKNRDVRNHILSMANLLEKGTLG